MTSLQRIVFIDDNDGENEYREIKIRQAGFAGEIAMIEDPLKALPFFSMPTSISAPTFFWISTCR